MYFHNGGGYDFHFIIRAIAHLQQKTAEEVMVDAEMDEDEEQQEVGHHVVEAFEHEPPLSSEHCERGVRDIHRLKLQVLVKSGERYLQVRLGPLVFLDSSNIFAAPLDSLIADLKSTEEDPAKAFPLLAERHPLFKDAELYRNQFAHPVFTKLWNRNCTAYRETVWQLLLKKIPMPFEKLTGPECWDMEAVMPHKSWYDSRLSGELCSDAKYAEIQKIANYFSFESFGEFHDAYLHTDMALADVLEAYREAFFENYGLDPVLYVTGASAAWDAMLKRCSPLQLISDRKIYEITRASVRGGLSNPFQPYAKANNPGLGEDYDPEQPTSHICKYDVNSQYPTVMNGPLPVDGGVLLTLAGDKKTRLKDLNKLLLDTDYESVDFSETHLVQVTYYVPLHAHDRIDWAPPARMSISTSQLSEYSKELLRRRGLEKAPGNLKLMPYLGTHVEEALQLRLLKFYMEKFEVRICDVHAVIRFKCRPFMRPFIEDCYARRLLLKKAGRKLQDKVLKTTMCVQFGKSVQNQEHFRNVEVFVDRAVYERKLASRRMVDFHAHPSSAGFFGLVQTKKFKGALLKSVPQIGTFVLDEARLGIMRNHYGFREIFDGGLTKPVDPSYSLAERSCMRAIYTDTDSDILQVYSEEHPSVKLARANVEGKGPCFWDVGGDCKQAYEYLVSLGADHESAELAVRRQGELGGFGDEGAPLTISEVVALGPKSYSEWLTDSVKFFHKFKSKGMAKLHRKQLTHEAYRKAWLDGAPGQPVVSYRFESQNHVVNLVRVEKLGLCAFTDKVYRVNQRDSRPHGHWRNLPEPLLTLCKMAFCPAEGTKKLPREIVDKVLSFVVGRGGYLSRELVDDDRWVGKIKGLDIV